MRNTEDGQPVEVTQTTDWEDVEVAPSNPPPLPQAVAESTTAATADDLGGATDKIRDRIVILGRRRAGKTVFLARLYDQLWNSAGNLHMRALSGESHLACMEVIEELNAGRWPASTLGSQYTDIEITYNGEKKLLVSLDYPGEVFHRAFVENAETDDARELVDHIDRASACILLIDPAVKQMGELREFVDDDYGMVQAIHRIREWPGGNRVPIVLVLTKCDLNKHLLQSGGGLRSYVAEHFVNLLRAVKKFKIFASAAVFTNAGENGELTPDLNQTPIGVIEPLEYCLHKIAEQEREEWAKQERDSRERAYKKKEAEEHEAKRKSIMFWAIFWSVATVILGVVGIITWILVNGGD